MKVKIEEAVSSKSGNEGKKKFGSTPKSRGDPKPCPLCGVIISNSYGMSCHLRRHSNDRPFKCDDCPAAFILVAELHKHKVKHQKDRPHSCQICQKTFKSIRCLNIHMDTHREKKYKCSKCDARFKKAINLKNHEKNVHSGNKLKCKYCYRTFAEIKYKEQHEKIAHINKPKRIDLQNEENVISKIPKKKNNYSKVTRIVDGEFRFYACKFCSERFKHRRDQLSHYQTSHKEEFDKVFKICKICGKLLTSVYYSSHMQAHAGIFHFNCTECDYKTNRKTDLRTHMHSHKPNTHQYNCSQCEKTFKQKALALLCEKKHSGIKDKKCHLCEMTFFTSPELRRHIGLSHNLKKCKQCGFKALSVHMLYDHKFKKHGVIRRKSLENKPYMCDKCGSFFPSLAALSNHNSKQHLLKNKTITEQYKLCFYCDYRYETNGELMNHCLKAHPSKVKQCEICNYETLNVNKFISHLRYHIKICPEELFVLAGINKIMKKKNFIMECFSCGFYTLEKESMNKHAQIHEHIKKIPNSSKSENLLKINNNNNENKNKNSALNSLVNLDVSSISHPLSVKIKKMKNPNKIEILQHKVSNKNEDLIPHPKVEEDQFKALSYTTDAKHKNDIPQKLDLTRNNSSKNSNSLEKVTIKIKKFRANEISIPINKRSLKNYSLQRLYNS